MSSIVLPELSAIVAMASNRVIGRQGQLPWHLPEDLKHFKQLTLGHTILMGRKTHDSIGRPLPRRRNIVLSREMKPADGVEVIRSIEELAPLCQPHETVFVIGGAEIFSMLLPSCGTLYLTWINAAYEGDSFMPPFEHLFSDPVVLGRAPGMEFRLYRRQREPSASTSSHASPLHSQPTADSD